MGYSLREKQAEIMSFMHGRDVFVSLLMGSGKDFVQTLNELILIWTYTPCTCSSQDMAEPYCYLLASTFALISNQQQHLLKVCLHCTLNSIQKIKNLQLWSVVIIIHCHVHHVYVYTWPCSCINQLFIYKFRSQYKQNFLHGIFFYAFIFCCLPIKVC